MADEKKQKKPLKPDRVPMPKQTPEERVRNFDEVALGFTAELAMEEAIETVKSRLSRIRTGKASPALLDGMMVEYYGAPTPLKRGRRPSGGAFRR